MSKIILGGGISGLSAGYYLRRKFPHDKISLIEASNRIGGWIKSTRQEGGYIFEQGPRTIRPKGIKGANTLQLVEELGLHSEIQTISSKHPAALNRMIYVNGNLHTLPSNLFSIFKKTSPFSKPLINSLCHDLIAKPKYIPENDETIYSFVDRRFGKEIADYAISPLICGICAGNAKHISVKFLMEEMFNYEQKYGSVAKGILYNAFGKNTNQNQSNLSKRAKQEQWSIYSFNNGLETLPNKLQEVNQQNGIQFCLNKTCTKISIDDKVTLHFESGDSVSTDHLISCIPSQTLGDLLVNHGELKDLLKKIPFVDVCVLNLHYKRKVLKTNGFGLLVPPVENKPILGVIFDSCCFPHGDSTILTVMMGGHWFTEHFGASPTQQFLLDIAINQLSAILDIKEKPDSYKINILNKCIPQYIVGHTKNVGHINDYINKNNLPLSLCGASYNGVGINDVIFSAKTAVDSMQ